MAAASSVSTVVRDGITARPATENEGSAAHPNIMILGLPGVGKTCFLNDMFKTNFERLPGARPVTPWITVQQVMYNGKPVTVWDTTGLFDPECNVETWAREMRGKVGHCKFQQIIYMIDASRRVTELDIMLVTALAHLLKDAAFEECVTLIFSKCDCALDAMTEEFRDEWIGLLNTQSRMKQICGSEFKRQKAFPYICQQEAEDLGRRKGAIVMAALQGLRLDCPDRDAIPAAFDALIEREMSVVFTALAPVTRLEITRETASNILKETQENVRRDLPVRDADSGCLLS